MTHTTHIHDRAPDHAHTLSTTEPTALALTVLTIALLLALIGTAMASVTTSRTRADAHDIAVTALDAPASVEVGTTVAIDATIRNNGTANETGVTVQLTYNATLHDETTIEALPSNSTANVTLLWTPTRGGSYTLTVAVPPTTGETQLANNQRNTTLTVTAPELTATPAPLAITLPTGTTDETVLTIENTGTANLCYTLDATIQTDRTPRIGIVDEANAATYRTLLSDLGFDWIEVPATTNASWLSANIDILLQDDHSGNYLSVAQCNAYRTAFANGVSFIISADDGSTSPYRSELAALIGATTLNDTPESQTTTITAEHYPSGDPTGIAGRILDFGQTDQDFIEPANSTILDTANEVSILDENKTTVLFLGDTVGDVSDLSATGTLGQLIQSYLALWQYQHYPTLTEATLTPSNATVDAGDETNITVTVDAGRLDPGLYPAVINIDSNDPATPMRRLPFDITVSAVEHDIRVETLTAPTETGAHRITPVQTQIVNQGTTAASNISVKLGANQATVNSTTVDALDQGEPANITLNWTPTATGTYNISITVQPVTGETVLFNNAMNTTIAVLAEPIASLNRTGIAFALDHGTTAHANITLENPGLEPLHYTVLTTEDQSETFPTTDPDPSFWAAFNGAAINDLARNPPSPPNALNLDGNGESATTAPVDLANSTGATVNFHYQLGGDGDAPESGDHLDLEYRNTSGEWSLLWQTFGTGSANDWFDAVDLTLPPDALHPSLQLRFSSHGTAGYDDFFVDTITLSTDWLPPWLTVAPNSGSVDPSGSTELRFTAEATDRAVGTYHATIPLETNDPRNPRRPVAIELTVSRAAHDLTVETLEIPPSTKANRAVIVNTTVRNNGTTDETGVIVELRIDGQLENATAPFALDALERANITFEWTPFIGGDLTVTTRAVPLAGESFLTNNRKNATLESRIEPDVDITPNAFTLTVEQGTKKNATATITNDGLAALNWSIWEAPAFNETFPATQFESERWSANGTPTVDAFGDAMPSPPYALKLNGDTDMITSRVLDLDGGRNCSIAFAYQRAYENGEPPDAGDHLLLEYRNKSGIWTELWRIHGNGYADAAFHCVEISLPTDAYHGTFRFRFSAHGNSGPYDDFLLDDIALITPHIPDWLTVTPPNGTVAAHGGASNFTLTVAPGTIAPGLYANTVVLATNDPAQSSILLDIDLEVRPAAHNLALRTLELPNWAQAGQPVAATAAIENRGRSNESSVTVALVVDGATVNTTAAFALDAGATTNVTLGWTPPHAANYTVTMRVLPDPAENITADNQRNATITVTLEPDIAVEPPTLAFDLRHGDSATESLNISNDGRDTLNWSIPTDVVYDESFPTTTFDSSFWAFTNGSPAINTLAVDEPSAPYALDLNGIDDSVTTQPFDLCHAHNATLAFALQRGGGGNAPETEDRLTVEYYATDRTWKPLYEAHGYGVLDQTFENITLALPADAFHTAFRFRFAAHGTSGPYDDFFIDDIALSVETLPPWLNSAPRSGTLAPQTFESVIVEGTVDPALAPARYNASIPIRSNDPDTPTLALPVSLTVSPALHNLAVGALAAPQWSPAGETVTIEALVENIGETNEPAPLLELIIDGSIVNSTTLPPLNASANTTIELGWVPTDQRVHNYSVHIVPVTGETLIDDNTKNGTVNVTFESKLAYYPANLSFDLRHGASTTAALTLENEGYGPLAYEI